MPRVCTVCIHPKHAAVNRQLVSGLPVRDIAKQFQLSSSAVDRHRREHLPKAIVKAKESREIAEGSSLLQQLQELGRDTRAVLDAARAIVDPPRENGDASTAGATLALKAIARLERQFELQARLMGELRDAPEGVASLARDTAAWIGVRNAIAEALAPYPEAGAAVAAALAEFAEDDPEPPFVGGDFSPGVM